MPAMPAKKTKEKVKLTAEKRKVVGRKVKKLRQDGLLPANIYGKKVKSLSVQVDLKTFLPVYKEVGETGIVNITVKGEEKDRPVLIHNVQLDPIKDQPLHADFYQVDLKQKITAEVPIDLTGESPAVAQKIGILIQTLNEVEVEALPTELPEKLEINVGRLEKVDDAVAVRDLKAPEGVKILTDAGQIIAKIEPPAKEEVITPPPTEAVPTEGTPVEGAAEEVGKPGEEKPSPEAPKQSPAKPEERPKREKK